jgi:uncharacterized membrane protein
MSAKKKRSNKLSPIHKSPQNPAKQQIIHREQSFTGPIPPPIALREYDDVLPGAAERILKMTEEQSSHRRELEKQVIDENLKQAKRGQRYGLIIGLAAIAVGGACIMSGQWIGGSIIGGGGLTGLVSVFIVGKRKEKRELQEKSQEEK